MKKLFIIPLLFTLIGCGNLETPSVDPKDQYVTYSIVLNDFTFPGSSKEISNDNNHAFQNTLVSFLNEKSGVSDLVSEVTADGYVALKKYDYSQFNIDVFNAIQINSGTQQGEFEVTFSKKLVSIKLTAQGYYKTFNLYDEDGNPYQVYSVDLDTSFLINGETWKLPEVDYDESEQSLIPPEVEIKEFNINSNKLSIGDDENLGRIMIHKMELTFEK